jgi:glucans biosynthesis protein C
LATPETTPERLHALDAVRAAALLLGIVLHAALSFIPDIELSLWPVTDTRPSPIAALLMFVIHVFRMSVFFLVAGLLSRVLLHRLGVRAFCHNRAARILAPLVLGWVVCFALIAAVALWALARAHGGRLPEPLPSAFTDAGLSFLHLWFLYLLLWLYAMTLGLRWLWRTVDASGRWLAVADRVVRAVLASTFGPLCLAVPVSVALFCSPHWNAWEGVPTPAFSWLPPASPLFIYSGLFLLGWAIDRQRTLLDELAARWPRHFAIGLVATLTALHLAGNFSFQPADPSTAKLAQAAAYGVGLVHWTLAFVGAGMRFFSRPRPAVRYLADASYWMYLAHLPVVMALQVVFMQVEWPWAIKFALINLLCFALLLWTYQHAVRPTWVGRLLNGRRHPRDAAA